MATPKRRYNITPKPRQRRAAKLIIANLKSPRPKTIRALLLEAGYPESTAKQQHSVLKKTGFIKCLEEAGATDDKLSKVLMEGLEAKRPWGKDGDIYADFGVRHKYMETALRLKGNLKEGEKSGDTYNTFIQQNNLDPNIPENKQLVDNTLEYLMQQTKRQQ
jgi:hypothetical protein